MIVPGVGFSKGWGGSIGDPPAGPPRKGGGGGKVASRGAASSSGRSGGKACLRRRESSKHGAAGLGSVKDREVVSAGGGVQIIEHLNRGAEGRGHQHAIVRSPRCEARRVPPNASGQGREAFLEGVVGEFTGQPLCGAKGTETIGLLKEPRG